VQSGHSTIEQVWKDERGAIRATLIRLLGDSDRAEDVLPAALEAALRQWPQDGWPDNPRAWLIRTARHKAIEPVDGLVAAGARPRYHHLAAARGERLRRRDRRDEAAAAYREALGLVTNTVERWFLQRRLEELA
jgi:predicted RNA polymerase sigma factor